MPTLLLEIGVEELPASACREATQQLAQLAEKHLGAVPARVLVGPRRLAILVEDLPLETPARFVQGPPLSVAFDADGRPTKAAEGFARKQGVALEALERREDVVGVTVPGRRLAEILPERLAEIVLGLRFGKSMQWSAGGMRFSRPVRWLLAKLDSETIPVEVEGIPWGELTYGHRFTHAAIDVFDAGAYVGSLRNAAVEPDAEERRRLIVAGLDALGEWSDPLRKLEEVIYLVESPIVLAGSFDERYLQLPERVVTTAMQSHQRYFPLGGSRFAFVANGGDPDVVRSGNERVLEGRLEDASFTFERDLADGIDGLAARLGSITFVARAGSFADKTGRLARLVAALGGGDAAREAARLAKADQAAELVREFPDLEGHIGAQYARLAGYPEAVCLAIEEQYLPDAAGGPLPQTEAGRVLAAAEKIDNLTVAFALDQRPTGSRDPYGLRRAAIGLCRLAIEGGVRLDVGELASLAQRLLVEQGAEVGEAPLDVADFVSERLEGLLEVPVELVRAARGSGSTDLGLIAEIAETLSRLEPEQLDRLVEVYQRADRLAGKAATEAGESVRPELLVEPAEREVAEALTVAALQIEGALGSGDVLAAVGAATKLSAPLDRFFADVMVMAEDREVRANRLRLLLDVRDALRRLGDLAQVPR